MRRFATFALLISCFHLLAQEKPKWDVSNPLGIPYKDISFTTEEGTWMCLDVSPDGQTLVFDLLGDIYTMPVAGGPATCIREGLPWEVQPRFSPDGTKISFTSDAGGGDNIWIADADGKNARQVTKESFRLLNNAVWVDNEYLVARKHFTSGRSLGAGELWTYHISGGEGIQLTKRKNDQQDLNEPAVSPDGRYIYFSEDLYPGGYFQYNKDPNDQIFAVRRYDRTDGKIEDVTGGNGGAVRPQVSRDGKWLAFVRRVHTQSVLFIHNLETGEEYPLYDDLDKDQQEAWTIFGSYPGFSWLSDRMTRAGTVSEIVIWAGGKIKKIVWHWQKISPDDRHEQLQKPQVSVVDIPFSCAVKMKVAETLRFENPAFEKEFTAKALRNAATSPDGKSMLFNAAGYLYQKGLPSGRIQHVAGDEARTAAEPAFAPDGSQAVYAVWSDENLGGLVKINFGNNEKKDYALEKGIYRSPSFSPDGKWLVYRKTSGDDEVGFAFSKKPGIYLLPVEGGTPKWIAEDAENPKFSADGSRIYYATGGSLFGALDKSYKSCDLNGKDEKVHLKSKYAHSFTVSPDGKWVAFIELHKTYICPFPTVGKTVDLSADMKSIPVTAVSRDAGYNLHWSGDSKKLHYTLGEEYFTIDLKDRFSFVEGAPEKLPPLDSVGLKTGLVLPSDVPEGSILFENARIITMEPGKEVIENGVIEVQRNIITFVGTAGEYRSRSGGGQKAATSINCAGKTIMPGIIDVHAHPGNFRIGLNPQKQWEYYANLAYGVTTMHDPSVVSETAFSNAEMIKAGRMIGPRLFSTGTILYGADGDFKAPVNSLDDARSALRRTKAWGAFSVKSYNQPRREQRQQIIAAARELNMLVVPEGGSFFHHNLNQVVDGHTGVEHNIPVAPLYKDVISMWKETKAHNTPTLIVNYGGLNGEYFYYQESSIWAKERLLKFTPKHVLDGRARHVTQVPMEEYENGHILVSKSCKKLQDAGVNINLGAHGQLNGLGAHWELWMLKQGGMSNMQALRCATINGAVYLGMDKQIGSIKNGKLADLVVLDANPLDNIRNTEQVRYVMVNGRLYDAHSLNEIGNRAKKRGKFWFEQPGSQINGAMEGGHTCNHSKCVCGH